MASFAFSKVFVRLEVTVLRAMSSRSERLITLEARTFNCFGKSASHSVLGTICTHPCQCCFIGVFACIDRWWW